MSAPMTLEELRDISIAHPCDEDVWQASFAAHIRERDELRAQKAQDAEDLREASHEFDRIHKVAAQQLRRAEKAEAELAALKKRIAGSRAQLVSVLCDADGRPCVDGSDEDRVIIDGALRLLVEGR